MSGTAIERDVFFRFYACEVSYFSAKVRPALRYKRLPFIEILPTPEAYRQVIRPRTGLSFIPVVVTPDDEALQDTSEILDTLEARFPEPPLYPTTPVQRVTAYLWELYADEFLIIPALHYRWSFPESEAKARADFAAFTGDADSAGRFADRIKAFTGPMGILPETIPAIEEHTRVLLDRLSAHFQQHRFLLGDAPSLADCALMGPLYPHLYLDAVPGRLLRETAPQVCRWIERMNHPHPVDPPLAPGVTPRVERGPVTPAWCWLADDALAPTMRPLLELIGRDAVPLLLDTVRAFDEWADRRPRGEEAPRAIGMHRTRLRGVSFDRYTSSYLPWMVQRPLDAYQALTPGERTAVDRALAGTGCEALLAHVPRHRVTKRRFKIVLAETETRDRDRES